MTLSENHLFVCNDTYQHSYFTFGKKIHSTMIKNHHDSSTKNLETEPNLKDFSKIYRPACQGDVVDLWGSYSLTQQTEMCGHCV